MLKVLGQGLVPFNELRKVSVHLLSWEGEAPPSLESLSFLTTLQEGKRHTYCDQRYHQYCFHLLSICCSTFSYPFSHHHHGHALCLHYLHHPLYFHHLHDEKSTSWELIGHYRHQLRQWILVMTKMSSIGKNGSIRKRKLEPSSQQSSNHRHLHHFLRFVIEMFTFILTVHACHSCHPHHPSLTFYSS